MTRFLNNLSFFLVFFFSFVCANENPSCNNVIQNVFMENIIFDNPVTHTRTAITNTYTPEHTVSTPCTIHHYRGALTRLSEQFNSVPPTL